MEEFHHHKVVLALPVPKKPKPAHPTTEGIINGLGPNTEAVKKQKKSVFLVDSRPLWGCSLLCGRRFAMEDAHAVVPGFFKVPIWLLTKELQIEGIDDMSGFKVPTHFFGVYDGHGGNQMASYCRDRMHLALAEELNKIVESRNNPRENPDFDPKKEWERAFTNCFRKVDEECDLIGPDTNGTTALIAVITSSHIIVANCGHSRAVLSRGKRAVPLSVDHNPKRAGEYERIDAEGGSFVIDQISMSRSIGDRYLRPWIIPIPEITVLPRARDDDCLILATDGLWGVVSNQTASDLAWKRIMVERKRGEKLMQTSEENVEFDGCDKGTESAAVALAKLALRKGSGDNVTVVVVDLKAEWKFKSNP